MTRNEAEDFLIARQKDIQQAKTNLQEVKTKQIRLVEFLKTAENDEFTELIEATENEIPKIDEQIKKLEEMKENFDALYPCSDEVLDAIAGLLTALGIEE